MNQPVIIYGIREVTTDRIFYVGATLSLVQRKAGGYGRDVMSELGRVDWEYVVLENCARSDSQAREQYWIDLLRAQGHLLLNKQRATPVRTFQFAGWAQKRLRLSPEGATNLETVAESLGVDQSEAVAELCRRFLKLPKR